MDRSTYYRCALAMALVLPALLWLSPDLGKFAAEWDVLDFLTSAVPTAGAPTAVVAVAVGAWASRERNDRLPRMVWIVPPLIALAFLVWSTSRTLIANAGLERGFLPSAWATAISLLTVAYAYVALVEIFRTMSEHRGWVRSRPAA